MEVVRSLDVGVIEIPRNTGPLNFQWKLVFKNYATFVKHIILEKVKHERNSYHNSTDYLTAGANGSLGLVCETSYGDNHKYSREVRIT
jgi:hypothetical protein